MKHDEIQRVKFVMPEIWEIDGKLYKVALNETKINRSPFGDSILDYTLRNLTFEPVAIDKGGLNEKT